MRVKPHDAHVVSAGQVGEFIRLGRQHAEFRVHAGGADVMVVPSAEARIDAHEYLAAAKHLRPHLERIQIVESDPHAFCENRIRIPRAAQNSA